MSFEGQESGDLRDSQKNTSTAAQRTHQIADDGQQTNDGSTEGGSSRNDALELLVHALLTVTGHDKTLLFQLLSDIAGAGAGDFDPSLGEDGACDDHVCHEDSGLDGVEEGFGEVERRRPGSSQQNLQVEWTMYTYM